MGSAWGFVYILDLQCIIGLECKLESGLVVLYLFIFICLFYYYFIWKWCSAKSFMVHHSVV